jgi:hypothetical protein
MVSKLKRLGFIFLVTLNIVALILATVTLAII